MSQCGEDEERRVYSHGKDAKIKKITFKEELITLLNEHGIEFDEKYLL